MKPTRVKYIAQLIGVRELALFGSAELSWWRNHLAAEGLEPIESEGRAQVILTGLDARWVGLTFRDCSVAVAARLQSHPAESGLFFAGALNASRFIVFFERRWFHLPYRFRADLHVALGDSSSIRVGGETTPDLLAELASRNPGAVPAAKEKMGYTGPLFLPTGGDRSRRRWLMVDIHGLTSTIDFDAARDRFEIGAECPHPIFAGLRASNFRGIRWHVRQSATHARSKTFQTRR